MRGIEAIQHYDGLAMAALGIAIVFASLVVLALIISQLHKVLFFWDNKNFYFGRTFRRIFASRTHEFIPEDPELDEIHESARQFTLLIHTMGEPFSLPKLIRTAETIGISHAHCATSRLILNNLIVPDKQGYFRLNHEAYDRLVREKKTE